MSLWAPPHQLLRTEIDQLTDEGCRIPSALRRRFDFLHPVQDAWNVELMEPLYQELQALEPDPGLAAAEPNDLALIQALRPDGPRDLDWRPSRDEGIDRFHGAWLGRASGCALGKPVESMGMGRRAGKLCGRADIKRYLENRDDWPLRDYFSGRDADRDADRDTKDGLQLGCPASQRENIAFMESDDDINYTLIGLHVVRHAGPDFTWSDVARTWLSLLPYGSICTAETQAYFNFISRSARMGADDNWHGPGRLVATPAYTRRHWNPYREWIGAQIRSDGYAWCCAGKPTLAAEFAWRDAHWTHERNGIYGAMFCAAMQAAAFIEHDPHRLIGIGLSEIPVDCRLARAVRATIDWYDASRDWQTCMDQVETVFPTMSPVHTINNALICVIALLAGGMDTVQTQAIAVMAGLDTDCNGATVGSIVGAAAGRAGFRMDLAARLNDAVHPSMIGYQRVTMSELARQTWEAWQATDASWQARSS